MTELTEQIQQLVAITISDNVPTLLLTDYTEGKYLEHYWRRRPQTYLFNQILPVKLYDKHVRLAQDLQKGAILVLRDLKLHRVFPGNYYAKLQGDRQNLYVLDHTSNDYREQKRIIER